MWISGNGKASGPMLTLFALVLSTASVTVVGITSCNGVGIFSAKKKIDYLDHGLIFIGSEVVDWQ